MVIAYLPGACASAGVELRICEKNLCNVPNFSVVIDVLPILYTSSG